MCIYINLQTFTGLDPDEGVHWDMGFDQMDKDKMPLRVMPNELKEIKEGVQIDCYLNLAGKFYRFKTVTNLFYSKESYIDTTCNSRKELCE